MKKFLYQLSRASIYSCMVIGGQLLLVGLVLAKDGPKESLNLPAAIPVSGTVTSEMDGEGIPGVNILVKGTVTGTVTDLNGSYSLNVPNEDDILVFSSIGYLSQEVAVNGRTTIDIILAEDVQSLDQIVVVGYSTQKKVNLTGSVASVDS